MQSFHFDEEDLSSVEGFSGYFYIYMNGGRPFDLLYLKLLKV